MLAAGAVAASVVFGAAEPVYLAVFLAALVLCSWGALWVGVRPVGAQRRLSPELVPLGEPVTVRVDIGVAGLAPALECTWRDDPPRSFRARARGPLQVPRGEPAHVAYEAIATRRGPQRFGPVRVVVRDPLGLARRSVSLGAGGEATVVPRLIELEATSLDRADASGAADASVDRLGQGADNLTPRAYVPGDSMRRVHWRASAHRGELMVRQEERESTPEATVVLESSIARWGADASRLGRDDAFERALSACASVALRLAHDAFVVDVQAPDGEPIADRLEGGDLGAEADVLLERLATLTAAGEDRLPALRGLVAGGQTGPLVLVIGRFAREDVDALAGVVTHTSLPLLLAAAPEPGALEAARAAGWRAAALGTDDDLRASWAAATARTHGRGIAAPDAPTTGAARVAH